MTFAEEIGRYRFRLFGPRFPAGRDGRYRLPRRSGRPVTVLESAQLVLAPNNVHLGPMEGTLKAPLRRLGIRSPALGAIVNAAVRHMPDGSAFVAVGAADELLLAGMIGNERKRCVGIDDFARDSARREVFRQRFDSRRSTRHSFFEGDARGYFRDGAAGPVGVLLVANGHSYRQRLDALRRAEPFLADECLLIAEGTNGNAPRRAALEFARESRLPWQTVLDERTAGNHPTLANGLLVLEARSGPPAPIELATDTRLVDAAEVERRATSSGAPLVTVLHYRNPSVAIQDYPNLEVWGLNGGTPLTDAFEQSTGDYVVVLDPDVELTSGAVSEAVRALEGGRPRRNARRRRHLPVAQSAYFPSWAPVFDSAKGAQTVTVARALTVRRDNLVALDLDPGIIDPDRELAVRFGRGIELAGPAARCSRVPSGVVAGRAGAVLTPDGRWLVESVGAASRAWPDLGLDNQGRVEVSGPLRESNLRVATVVCERRREWWTANFGHWTLDVLTRVAILLRAGVPANVKLLVPEPVLPFQRDTLVGLGIERKRILAWDGLPTRFRMVYVPTARPTPPFVFPAGVELLRELGEQRDVKLGAGRRLFVSRRKLRRTTRIANEDELLDVAKEFGFTELKPETLPYSKQRGRFAEAEIVVGAHGSGLVNAALMARGTAVCELAPERLHPEKVPNFWDLAACGGQRYGLCVGSGRRVDPERFKRVLRDLLASQNA